MAVDVAIFGADIPAGTYSRGDVISLGNITGPATVRSGRGAAILKRITALKLSAQSGSFSSWKIKVKNSDWIDPAVSVAGSIGQPAVLDRRSGAIQAGHDCPLTPNSSWEVIAECMGNNTTTAPNSLIAIIEIDYPSVSAITDPDKLAGYPTSIEFENTVTINAPGSITTATWDVFNVDIFKAGYEYALEKLELMTSSVNAVGLIAISGAAGMGGLTRMIPITNLTDNIRPLVEYATRLQKGPMDLKFMLFNESGGSATTDTINLTIDFVKRKV